MKSVLGLVTVAIFLLLPLLGFAPLVQAAGTTTASSSSPSSGYASYGVTVTYNGTTRSISLNESITPSSSPGKSILLVSVETASSNFTYSHLVNSSSTLFPYLPAVSNQSYTYSGKNYSLSATISQRGTSPVTFQGKSYTLEDYAFSASLTSAKGTHIVRGTVSVFPSDLIYSVTAQTSTASVEATLKSTSLPLNAAATSASLQAASAGLGISLAAAVMALSLGVRMKKKKLREGGAAGPSKPDHWVD